MKDGDSYICRVLKGGFYFVIRTSAKEVMRQLASICLTDSKILGKIIRKF